MVLNQFGAHIKVFRSDNAYELKFVDFFNEKGVFHQFSNVQTPQQNSVVERKHQHYIMLHVLYSFNPRFLLIIGHNAYHVLLI